MKRLINTFKDFFSAAAQTAGDLTKTANFTLENVDWEDSLSLQEPTNHQIVDAHLETACACSGADGSMSNEIATALLAVSKQLHWRASSKSSVDGPDIAILLRNLAVVTIIGPGAPLQSDKVLAGFSLQAPDTYYPPHAHDAEESYWIIGGNGDWKVDTKPWFAVQPGDGIYHGPMARHVMQTNEQPLLTVWLWTSDLDSEVLIVRG